MDKVIVEGIDYKIIEVDLPHLVVDGAITVDENDFYTIILNRNQTDEKKRAALIHELNHIRHNDFYRDVPTEQKEVEAG